VIGEVVVVVPAADEQDRIGACLDALCVARGALAVARPRLGVRMVVVLDDCTDATGAVVASFPGVEVVSCGFRRVGAARAYGVTHVLSDGGRLDRLWLASTDADSQVPADWFVTMVALAEQGADLVLGTVLPGRAEDGAPWTSELDAAWRAQHLRREGHPHVHGANLGIRASAYTALGGWPPVATGEDVLLATRAAARPDVRVVRTARIPVSTSVRRVGRAPEGFSSYLRGLAG